MFGRKNKNNLANVQGKDKRKLKKWQWIVIVLAILFIFIMIGGSDSAREGFEAGKNAAVTSASINLDNVDGFQTTYTTGDIHTYSKEYKGQSYSVTISSKGTLGMHDESYPVDRNEITINGINVIIGYKDSLNIDGAFVSNKYESVSFDFENKGKIYSGEISNLAAKSDKENLEYILKSFIQESSN